MNTRSQRGFTLYELLITLLVIGVILSLGVPNIMEFTANSRVSATANDLHSSFLLARSEAARARASVAVCAWDINVSPNPQCTGGVFDGGWIVFVDDDEDGVVEGSDGNIFVDPGESVLRTYAAVDDQIDITANGGASYFSFAATGLGRGDVAAAVPGGPSLTTARICDDRGNQMATGGWSAARLLIVTPVGRATVVRDAAQIAVMGDCP